MKKYIFSLIGLGILISPSLTFAFSYNSSAHNFVYSFSATSTLVYPSSTISTGNTLNLNQYDNITGSSTIGSTLSDCTFDKVIWACSGITPRVLSFGTSTGVTLVLSDTVLVPGCNPTNATSWQATCEVGTSSQAVSLDLSTQFKWEYPTNNLTTPSFSHFLFSFQNLIASHTYVIAVDYLIPNVTQNNHVQSGGLGSKLSLQGLSILHNDFGIWFNPTGSTTIQAKGVLYDVTNFQGNGQDLSPYFINEHDISWIQLLNGNTGNATTSYVNDDFVSGTTNVTTTISLNPIPVLVASSTFYCQAPNNITDIGGGISYGLCSFASIMLQPSANVQTYFSNSITGVENVFPFRIVYSVFSKVQNSVSSTNSTEKDLMYTLPASYSQAPLLFAMVSSSTLKQTFNNDSASVTQFMNLEGYALDALTLFAIFMLPYHHFHKTSKKR